MPKSVRLCFQRQDVHMLILALNVIITQLHANSKPFAYYGQIYHLRLHSPIARAPLQSKDRNLLFAGLFFPVF